MARESFNPNISAYLHEYPVGGRNGVLRVPLLGVVVSDYNKWEFGESYTPGIQLSIADFGLPERRLFIEGEFQSVSEAATGQPHMHADSIIVNYGQGRGEREDDFSQYVYDGDTIGLVMPRFDPGIGLRNDTPIRQSYGRISNDEDPLLTVGLKHDELSIALNPELIGRVVYYSMTEQDSDPSRHKTPAVDNKLTVLGLDETFFAGLSTDQKIELVKFARKRVSTLFHPDKDGGDTERMKLINATADELLDQLKPKRP